MAIHNFSFHYFHNMIILNILKNISACPLVHVKLTNVCVCVRKTEPKLTYNRNSMQIFVLCNVLQHLHALLHWKVNFS